MPTLRMISCERKGINYHLFRKHIEYYVKFDEFRGYKNIQSNDKLMQFKVYSTKKSANK